MGVTGKCKPILQKWDHTNWCRAPCLEKGRCFM